jgi:hypothetical protein
MEELMSQENMLLDVDETQESAPAAEKMLSQSEVDRIVKQVKVNAADKARRDALAEMQASRPVNQPVDHNVNVTQGFGGMTPRYDDIRQMVADETQKQQDSFRQKAYQEARIKEGERVASEFFHKLQSGQEKYEDFETVVGKLPFSKIPEVVELANSVDNTDDIMYELAKNPIKLASIKTLSSFDRDAAFAEIKKISASIKNNQQAQNQVLDEPMRHLKSSPTQLDDGEKSVADYMKIFR